MDPRLQVDTEQKRDILPPVRTAVGPHSRRPSYQRLLPHPQIHREPELVRLPPIKPSPYSVNDDNNRRPWPITPVTPSSSRKRSAEEANLTSRDDPRLQTGRRQEEQPSDANYRMETQAQAQLAPPLTEARLRHPAANNPVAVEKKSERPPANWHMSLDLYNRASDNDIGVDFPGLHQTGNEVPAPSAPVHVRGRPIGSA